MSKVLITRSKLDGLASTIAAKSGATLPLTIAQMDAAVQGISGGGGYTRTEVVPSQIVTPNSSRTAGFTATTPFVDGEYYVVTYDGAEYVCTAETLWTDNIILGDAQVVWQTSDVLYPFALITTANDSEGYFTTTSAHTIKVELLEFTGDATILSSKTITANGTYSASSDNADGYASVTVSVPSSAPTLQAKTNISPTTSSQTITPDSGYDGLSSVQINAMPTGTAGTPTASKGTVSNHAVSVTPSVTNTTGYITGSTKTGTAVTVSASELVSGSETKTANGTYDVTNLAQLVVNVASPVKTATGTFTGNGTRTIDISSVTFEPDIVYFTSDPGTTASSGTVAAIIVRDMMAATRYRNATTTNSHYAIPGIVNLNTSGSSYSWRATYDSTNSKLTLYCYSSNARGLLTNGRTYSYTFVKWT